MTTFLISDVSIKDENTFQSYRSKATASIERYGGRHLARGGEVQALESTWTPHIIITVKFPAIEQARAWYYSPEYAAALEH